MCGRVRLENDYSEIVSGFRVGDAMRLNIPPRWNGAPTQDYPILRFNPETKACSLAMMRWGLIPAWSKDDKIGYSTVNARSEELAGKPTFRSAWKAGRRCVVPLTGFYEWKKLGPKEKQPYLITRADKKVMAVAGLWESKKLDGGDVLRSFTIVTTAANGFMSPIHDRMPVVLAINDVDAWLGEKNIDLEAVA